MNLKIEKRDGINVVVYADCSPGWSRPASADEVALWDRVVELEGALREIMAFDPGKFRTLADEIKIHGIAASGLGKEGVRND